MFRSCGNLIGDICFRNISEIKSYTFYYCTSLYGPIDFGNATKIGINVFEYCSDLTTVNIENIKYISQNAFRNCVSLTGPLNFSNVVSIGVSAFEGCSKLEGNLDLPCVTSISNRAFYNCVLITNVTLYQSSFTIGEDAFTNITNITTLHPIKFDDNKLQKDLSNITVRYLGSLIPSGNSSVYNQVKIVYVYCHYKSNTLYGRQVKKSCNSGDETIAIDEPYKKQENQNNQQFTLM